MRNSLSRQYGEQRVSLFQEMINENKHRNEKSIWPERDLEDVSDSGVMSLPTSEDLTSDSELGDTVSGAKIQKVT